MEVLSLDPEGLPKELLDLPQWVCWRVEERDGKATKVPIDPSSDLANLSLAKTNDPETWKRFRDAENLYVHGADIAGVGFVFTADDPYCGVDLDDCRDQSDGTIEEWAAEIIRELDSYAEISPSGTGVKIIIKAVCPKGGNRRGSVEIYDHKRYFALTGRHIESSPRTIEERQAQLDALHAEHVARKKSSSRDDSEPLPAPIPHLDDAEIIRRASNAKNGDKFRRLWSGDKIGYTSDSEADLALCSMIAFWTGPDMDAIDRVFRQSRLFRPKWLRQDYRERTIRLTFERAEFHGNGARPRKKKSSDAITIDKPETVKFPIDALPAKCRKLVDEVATSMGCPRDFPGVAVLAVAATCLGGTRALVVKGDWKECPRLYVAVVADPGATKTPALGLVCKPLYDLQRSWKKRYDAQHEEYVGKKRIYDKWLTKGGGGTPPEEATKPVFRHLYTTDATVEKLAVALQENPRGFAMLRDEITSWVTSMNQYKGGKGSDRQFWLSAWAGTPIKVDRKNEEAGPICVSAPFLTVLGGIQPDKVPELEDEDGKRDGFIDRILFAYPERRPPIGWSDFEVSASTEGDWKLICENLLDQEMAEFEDGSPCPFLVEMNADAKAFYVQWKRDHAAEQSEANFPSSLSGPWSKMENYLARLTLVVHYLRRAEGEITGENIVDQASVVCGCVLCDYFKAHARKVYDLLASTAEDRRLDKIVLWIDLRGGEATTRQLTESNIAGVKKKSEAVAVFAELQDRGFGEMKEERSHANGGGHSVIKFIRT